MEFDLVQIQRYVKKILYDIGKNGTSDTKNCWSMIKCKSRFTRVGLIQHSLTQLEQGRRWQKQFCFLICFSGFFYAELMGALEAPSPVSTPVRVVGASHG